MSLDPEPKSAQSDSQTVHFSFSERPRPTVTVLSRVTMEAILVRNFISEEQCLELILGSISGLTEHSYNRRRVLIKSPDLSAATKERLTTILKDRGINVVTTDQWRFREINDSWRMVENNKGSQFPPHYDAPLVKSVDLASRYTILIYLNQPEAGGELVMKLDNGETVTVCPRAGDLVLIDHSVLHWANEVRSGNKYLLRSELIYQRKEPIETEIDREAFCLYQKAISENSVELREEAFKISPALENLVYNI